MSAYVLLTDNNNATFLVACPDGEGAERVGIAAIFNDGGVSAWRLPDWAVTDHEAVRQILNRGEGIAELFEANLSGAPRGGA